MADRAADTSSAECIGPIEGEPCFVEIPARDVEKLKVSWRHHALRIIISRLTKLGLDFLCCVVSCLDLDAPDGCCGQWQG
jgi:hypothetical protein